MSTAVLIPFTILCFGPRMKQVIVPFFGAVINMLMSSILIGWFAADAHHEDAIVHGGRVQRLWCSVGNTAWKCDPEVPLELQENKMIISVHKRGRVSLVSYASYLVVARHQRLALPGLTTCFYLHINTKSIQSCSLTMKLSIHDDLVSTAKKQINSHSMAREWGHRSVGHVFIQPRLTETQRSLKKSPLSFFPAVSIRPFCCWVRASWREVCLRSVIQKPQRVPWALWLGVVLFWGRQLENPSVSLSLFRSSQSLQICWSFSECGSGSNIACARM